MINLNENPYVVPTLGDGDDVIVDGLQYRVGRNVFSLTENTLLYFYDPRLHDDTNYLRLVEGPHVIKAALASNETWMQAISLGKYTHDAHVTPAYRRAREVA